jgi:hypothetical protein
VKTRRWDLVSAHGGCCVFVRWRSSRRHAAVRDSVRAGVPWLVWG